jgi:hypothetical protein
MVVGSVSDARVRPSGRALRERSHRSCAGWSYSRYAMSAPERNHLHKTFPDAVAGITSEVHARLDAEMSEKDAQAVTTAIEKAVVAGVRLGFVEAAAQLDESDVPVHITRFNLTVDVTDDWAEQYSDGAT